MQQTEQNETMTQSYFAIRVVDDPETFVADDGSEYEAVGDIDDCSWFSESSALDVLDILSEGDPETELEIVAITETITVSREVAVVDMRELRRHQETLRLHKLEESGQARLFPREGALANS